jgi:hypothetical protein
MNFENLARRLLRFEIAKPLLRLNAFEEAREELVGMLVVVARTPRRTIGTAAR